MARPRRVCPANVPQHIIQRGNDRRDIFVAKEDYQRYLNWLRKVAEKYGVSIHAYVLMSNHVHLLATPTAAGATSSMMQTLGRRYVRYFNHRYDRTGTLWEGRFRSGLIDSEYYLLACARYIEMNPVRAGMVDTPEAYRWSSYRSNALGQADVTITPHEECRKLGRSRAERQANYRALFDELLSEHTIAALRASNRRGTALGSEQFKDRLEQETGYRVRGRPRGRPPRAKMGSE